MVMLPSPGQLLLPGPIDPTAGQQYISATPLTGIRQFGANDNGVIGTITNTQYNPATGGGTLTPQQIQQMRDEMNGSSGTGGVGGAMPQAGQPNSQQGTQQQQQPGIEGAAPAVPVAPGGAPPAKPIAPQQIKSPTVGGAPVTGAQAVNSAITPSTGGDTDQSTRLRMIIPPQAQSSVYAELLKRHQESATDQNVSDAQAARDYNAAQRAMEQMKNAKPGQPGAPGAPTPGAPGAPAAPGAAAQPGALPGAPAIPPPPGGVPAVPPPAGQQAGTPPGVPDYAKQNEALIKQNQRDIARLQPVKKKPEPVKVSSFATGMKGKGLSEIMKQAEVSMKDGKFTAALESYDKAEQVAPNNPLIRLGRANAELGASYYARAEAHLREAFNSNPELLNGQYDLIALLGEQRLQVLVRDLKEIAAKEQREPRPQFLLAYIAYNTGHETDAEARLDLAEKRSGGKDPFYKLLRDNWSLPSGAQKPAAPSAPAPDLNK
jgi:tetratricopeptide (TPR) repeat protein